MKKLVKNLLQKSKIQELDRTFFIENNNITIPGLTETILLKGKAEELKLAKGVYNELFMDTGYNLSDMPKIAPDGEVALEIDVHRFIAFIDFMQPFSAKGKDFTRPVFNSIYFDAAEETVVATESHKMATKELKGIKKSFFLPFFRLKILKDLVSFFNEKSIEILVTEKNIILSTNNFAIILFSIEAQFPDYLNVYPGKIIGIKITIQDDILAELKNDFNMLKRNEKELLFAINYETKNIKIATDNVRYQKKLPISVEKIEYTVDKKNSILMMNRKINSTSKGVLISDFLALKENYFYITPDENRFIILESKIKQKRKKRVSCKDKVKRLEAEVTRLKKQLYN